MAVGEIKTLNGFLILRYGDDYLVNERESTLNDAIEIISKNKSKGFPYNSVAFLIVKPPSKVLGHYQIHNKKEHKELLKKALDKKALVYYCDVVVKEGEYTTPNPWVVDYDSVRSLYGSLNSKKPDSNIKSPKPHKYVEPQIIEEQVDDQPDEPSANEAPVDEMRCPFCGKKMNSTPGRTLHIKSKHPDMYNEYLNNKKDK